MDTKPATCAPTFTKPPILAPPGLPRHEAVKGYAHVVREDLVKPDLLFVGTEFGLFLSIDGGKQWAQFTGNLPACPMSPCAIWPSILAIQI